MLAALLNGCAVEAAFATRQPHWGKLHDSYHVHRVFYGAWGDVLGEYYQPRKDEGFTATCERGQLVTFAMESLAIEYVERDCPDSHGSADDARRFPAEAR